MRRKAIPAFVLALGCAGEARAPAAVAVAPIEAPMRPIPSEPLAAAPAAALDPLVGWLAGCAVDDASFRRHKLYTWTTAARIAELRADRVLLAHGRMPGEMSRFDVEITEDAHPLAAHLRHRRRGRRYAWITPWATRMGWEGHDYGEHLVEITLAADAWVARFAPGTAERWRVIDEAGRVVPEEALAGQLGRIGAVYHVASGEHAYREVIVVDERRVERWALATPTTRARLAVDARNLRDLADRFEAAPPALPAALAPWLRAGWPRAEGTDLAARYRSCLALGSAHYLPTAAHLRAIAERLEATPEEVPLEHVVETDRWFGVVVGTRIQCDPTAFCWEDWHRAGTLPVAVR